MKNKIDGATLSPPKNEITLESILDYEQPNAYRVSSVKYNENYSIPVLTAGKSFIIKLTH